MKSRRRNRSPRKGQKFWVGAAGLALVAALLSLVFSAAEQRWHRMSARTSPTQNASNSRSVASTSPTRKPGAGIQKDLTTPDRARDLDSDILSVSLRDTKGTREFLERVRQLPQDDQTRWILSLFLRASPGQPGLREKAVWLAGEFNSPDLLPLWEDIVFRLTPMTTEDIRVLSETDVKGDDHISEVYTAIQIERTHAIGALAELAAQSTDSQGLRARSLLLGVATGHAETPGLDDLLRLTTARELQSVDPETSFQLAEETTADDPVRRALASSLTQPPESQ